MGCSRKGAHQHQQRPAPAACAARPAPRLPLRAAMPSSRSPRQALPARGCPTFQQNPRTHTRDAPRTWGHRQRSRRCVAGAGAACFGEAAPPPWRARLRRPAPAQSGWTADVWPCWPAGASPLPGARHAARRPGHGGTCPSASWMPLLLAWQGWGELSNEMRTEAGTERDRMRLPGSDTASLVKMLSHTTLMRCW